MAYKLLCRVKMLGRGDRRDTLTRRGDFLPQSVCIHFLYEGNVACSALLDMHHISHFARKQAAK